MEKYGLDMIVGRDASGRKALSSQADGGGEGIGGINDKGAARFLEGLRRHTGMPGSAAGTACTAHTTGLWRVERPLAALLRAAAPRAGLCHPGIRHGPLAPEPLGPDAILGPCRRDAAGGPAILAIPLPPYAEGARAAPPGTQRPSAGSGRGGSNFMRSTRSLMFFTPSHFLT